MQLVRTLIAQNNEKHEHFAYYETVIDVIQQHEVTQPDICIESCKSLIEGISKTILKNLDTSYNEQEIKKLDVAPLFKKAMLKLADFDEDIEIDFINRSHSLIQNFGEIRNARGDISHGRAAPKEIFSTPRFSKLVVQMTEGIVSYVLEHYFSIDLSYKQEVLYEDNPDFNQWLDDANPLGTLSYSKALFDQDNVAYFEQLLDYQAEQDEELVLDIEEIHENEDFEENEVIENIEEVEE